MNFEENKTESLDASDSLPAPDVSANFVLPERQELAVHSRRLFSRLFFWPVFLVVSLGIVAGAYGYLEKFVRYNSLPELLPADAVMYAVFPSRPTTPEFKRFWEILNRLPGSQDLASLSLEQMFASEEASDIVAIWSELRGALGEEISLAFLDSSFVVSTEFDRSALRTDLPTSLSQYRGQNILSLKTEDMAEPVFIWRVGKRAYASTADTALKKLIDIKLAKPFSQLPFFGQPAPAALSEHREFQRTFGTFSENKLGGVYLNLEKAAEIQAISQNFSDQISHLGLPSFLSNVLTELAPELSRSSVKVASLGVWATEQGIVFQSSTIPKVPWAGNIGPQNLAYGLPAEISGVPIQAYIEFDNLGLRLSQNLERLQNQAQNFQFLAGSDAALYGEVAATLTGPAGLLLGIDTENKKTVAAFIATFSERSRAEAVAGKLVGGAKLVFPEADFKLTDNYLIIANSPEVLLAFNNAPQISIGQKLNLKYPFVSYGHFSTNFAIEVSKGVLSGFGIGSETDIWRLIEIFSRALPTVNSISRELGDTLSSSVFIEVNKLSAADEVEAQKILDRLNQRLENRPTDVVAIRDASRRADMVILEGAIKDFAAKHNRAPSELNELVPIYLAAIPTDPATGAYQYSNTRVDRSFSIVFNMETETNLGPSGIYCLTTLGVQSASSCQEK